MTKNKADIFQDTIKSLKKIAKNAPSSEEILRQFDQGDFSSLDPQFFKTGHDLIDKFSQTQPKKKRKSTNQDIST